MGQRDKMIELLEIEKAASRYMTDDDRREMIADFLLNNGVVVLPVKLGDPVYRISQKFITKMRYIEKTNISRIAIDARGIFLFCACQPTVKCVYGKNVFLSREDAENALREYYGGCT